MGRESIEIDDDVLARVMRLHGLATKTAAVDFALRRLLGGPLSRDEALAMRGSGWSVAPDARGRSTSDA